jgi:glycosyltransferase involved in cell wall biosynthesis
MRVILWNAHWKTLGGGEVYAGYLADYLARLGYEVELVGLDESPFVGLQTRLGLNLNGIRYTKIPNEMYLLALLRHDDLFINGSFGSTFTSPVKNSIYICHFPVVSKKRKVIAKFIRNDKNLVVASNAAILHTIGDQVLLIGDGLAYFFANERMSVNVEFGHIAVYKDFELKANLDSKGQYNFESKGYYSIKSLSKVVPVTMVSGVSSLSWMRKFFIRKTSYQANFAKSYSQIWANSKFTAGFISRDWNRKSRIVFPPHIERTLHPAERGAYDILSIGRFMSPKDGHCKNQLKLIEAFEKLSSGSTLPWKLHLAGGVDPMDDQYFRKVRNLVESKGLNVNLYPNCLQSELDHLLQTSQFYWHATGMGVAKRNPQEMEHFGIAVVEAINASLIPVVYDIAGPAEILVDFPRLRFSSIDELVEKTIHLSGSDNTELHLQLNFVREMYSNFTFEDCIDKALLDLGLPMEQK